MNIPPRNYAVLIALACLCFAAFVFFPAEAAAFSWDAAKQGGFILSLARDKQNNLWVSSEDDGLFRYASATGKWTQFTVKDGLGDDDIYALACDEAGRIWAGTPNHGVSVWNGHVWKTYDQVTGPLGAHVTALTVCPTDGAVWGATEAGLFRYAHDKWTYYTRAEGLPSDQASSLAFDKHGNLYVGTECDGLAIGSPTTGYHKWRRVTGPDSIPDTPSGVGLPSDLVNAVLVSRDGGVYVGTDAGLSRSLDGGETWHYIRGADWLDKLKDLYRPKPPMRAEVKPFSALLREDYVTALAQDAQGRILVGHRQKGIEALDPYTGKHISLESDNVGGSDYIFTMLAAGSATLVGRYGGGLTLLDSSTALPADTAKATYKTPTSFPAPAKAPTLAALHAMTQQVQLLHGPLPVGGATYLGQDWATQGDWVGRYGRKYAVLCAARAPLDHDIQAEFPYSAHVFMGPHHDKDDGVRNWCSAIKTESPKSLYDPIPGYRRQAEWDDHGEAYIRAFDGPDLWIAVNVPEGVQRLSLYFVNKGGHDSDNGQRDYVIAIKPWQEVLQGADDRRALAHARVVNFWGGVYQSFVLRGPSKYWVKIGRNYSKNTIVSAVLMDKLKGPSNMRDNWPLGWMGGVRYNPPDPDAPIPPDPHLLDKLLAMQAAGIHPPAKTAAQIKADEKNTGIASAARAAWSTLDDAWDQAGSTDAQLEDRLLAFRAADQADAPSALLGNWRWNLRLWTPPDRRKFKEVMKLAHKTLLENNPQMKNKKILK